MVFRYRHPEWFEDVETPELSPRDTVILWGAGKVGSVVAHSARNHRLNVAAFVDSAADKQGTVFCGYQVISPAELEACYPDAVVIVSCAFPVVYEELKRTLPNRVYSPHFLLLNVDFAGYEGNMTDEFAGRIVENALRNYAMHYGTGFLIERLMFLLTDKCTLNCKNCDGYIPFHTHPRADSLNTVKSSYEKIIRVCKYIETIDLLGGEPLIHPEIGKITRFFVEETQSNRVVIISNGTIIPRPDLVEVLRSPKCVLRISDYGDLSRSKDKIISLCEKEHIKYELTNYQYWDRMPLIQQTGETDVQLDAKFDACTSSVFYVKREKIFQCTFVAGLSDLGEQLIPDMEKNYVDLSGDDREALTERIAAFAQQLHSRKHLDACKYCPGSHCLQFEDKQPVAEQVKGKQPLELLFKDGVRLCD